MRTAAMDDYFFNELKSHPLRTGVIFPCNIHSPLRISKF